jgi:hypothetical protein
VKGIFTYKVTFPADVTSAYLSFGNEPPVTLTSGQWVSVEKTPGQYDLSIFLRKEPLTAGTVEKVHVYSGLESKAEFTFEAADFVQPAPLSADTWVPGTLTASGGIAWYSFPAEAGKTYALQWEDRYNTGTYTGAMYVAALGSDGYSLAYGYPGDSPLIWSVSSNDTIYVRVENNGTPGTYRLKYFDASNLKPQAAPFVASWIPNPDYTILWEPVGGADEYQVSRSNNQAGPYTDIGSPVAHDGSYAYFFTDTGVSSGTY